jgi:hypothetical protein
MPSRIVVEAGCMLGMAKLKLSPSFGVTATAVGVSYASL